LQLLVQLVGGLIQSTSRTGLFNSLFADLRAPLSFIDEFEDAFIGQPFYVETL
jgi:hypothetical protein